MTNLRAKRIRMHRENPHCHWCGELTVLDQLDRFGQRSRISPHDLATIDHLVERKHRSRRGTKGGIVLACYECNQRRGRFTAKRLLETA